MDRIKKRIMQDALNRYTKNRGDHTDPAMYIENRVLKKGERLKLVDQTIVAKEPSIYVFIDEQPKNNWGHACQYLLYNAKTGKLSREVTGKFPPFLFDKPSKTMESFRTPIIARQYANTRPCRVPLEPARLSSYKRLGAFPFKHIIKGHRYAILFSGASNCRHVNDFEFLYRTLIDVYGFNANDIYVCNYDGNVNWNVACWGGFCEPAQDPVNPINYPVDNTPFRLQVNEPGTRAGFQNIINQLAARIRRYDCLFIFTNNHGWYGTGPGGSVDEGYLSTFGGGQYWAGEIVSDLSALPHFRTLLVVMEQCSSGSFIQPLISNSPAERTVIQTAVPAKQSSAGGWFFDPWIELWISAMAGVRGDGSALAVSPDDNLDNRISAWEAYDYASSQDNPQMQESSSDLSHSIFLSSCTTIKHFKEFLKDRKEYKEVKEVKEVKETLKEQMKDYKELKETGETKIKEFKDYPKEVMKDSKEAMMEKAVVSDYIKPGVEESYLERTRAENLAKVERLDERIKGLERRMRNLEQAMNRLAPFIKSNLRPDLKGKAFE